VIRRSEQGSVALRLVISLVFLLLALGIFLFRQTILDTITVWRYQPSAAIAAVSERASLSDRGQFLFYASQPDILDRDPFNEACRGVLNEATAVLGCYSRQRIHLFNVTNAKLDGIKEVTAAHEMLHAAYERLSPQEKARVDALLEAQDLGEDSERIGLLMQQYAKTEPGEHLNELHSIVGTEVAQLGPELEEYYGQYFDDRDVVVGHAQRYESVFAGLKAQQQALVEQLNALAESVEVRVAAYKRNIQVLQSDVSAFNARATSGSMSSAEYNSQRAVLEARQTTLRTEYDQIQDLASQYDQKHAELEALNLESSDLNRSINSTLSPVPELQ